MPLIGPLLDFPRPLVCSYQGQNLNGPDGQGLTDNGYHLRVYTTVESVSKWVSVSMIYAYDDIVLQYYSITLPNLNIAIELAIEIE